MDKRVIVIASGETERRALPHLLRHLADMGIGVSEVRTPRRHRALDAAMADKLIKAAWYANAAAPPDKFVVLLDADGKVPDDVIGPFEKQIPDRLSGDITPPVLITYAQQHLEAWFFADAANLRSWLGGRALGSVDASRPDEIQNPKRHLRNLLGNRVYTARVAEEIACTLDAQIMVQRSPSFRGFVEAIVNGPSKT